MKLYKVGRALFGGYFVYSGINHFVHKQQLAKHAESKHIPKPEAAVIATGIAMIAGGATLALGLKPKYAAMPLMGFLATVSPTVHAFWKDKDHSEKMHDMVDFTKNLALLGGAMALADARAQR